MKLRNRVRLNGRNTHYLALSGMTLTLCLLSLMLFRGVFSLVQALIIPIVFVFLTTNQPWKYTGAASISMLILTFVFFSSQIVFMIIYLMMASFLMVLVSMIQRGSRKSYLLFIPYLIINGTLLFVGLRMTDVVFQTQLHAMMLRLTDNNNFLYVAIMMMESAFISVFHLLIILYFKRRKDKLFNKNVV